MNVTIQAKPAFAYLDVYLEPGETIIAESDAMSSMDTRIDMVAKLNGGIFGGLIRKFLTSESLFINHFVNTGTTTAHMTIVQSTPGDTVVKELDNETYYLQPGAYIASTPSVKLGVKWAGISSFIGGEGLFKFQVSAKEWKMDERTHRVPWPVWY